MSIFTIRAFGNIEEYIELDVDFSDIQMHCRKSEMQYLSKEKLIISTTDTSGIEFPDVIVQGDVWLFSDYLIQNIRNDIENYVFLKPLEVNCDAVGKREKYWIVVPPRIDCLDLKNSQIDYNWNFKIGIIPVLDSKKTVIDEKLTGRYLMFKVLGIDDSSIYLKEELFEKISKLNPVGIKFIKC